LYATSLCGIDWNMAKSPTNAPDPIDEIRSKVTASGHSLRAIAREAGLHRNTMNRLRDTGWDPQASTLAKLRRALKTLGRNRRATS
jgi:lambda repressor-like predicted transcriptional regulator